MFKFLESPQLDTYTDWIATFATHQGIIAPFLLLFLEESGIPLPIPGDVYVAFAGYQVSKGRLSYPVAFTLLLLSVLVGSSILYYISSRWGKMFVRKLGRFLQVDDKKMAQVETWFKKYGIWVIIFGRHIPGFRIPVTIFSGVSGVPYKQFITGTLISVIFWIALYLYIGGSVGKKIERYLHHGHPLYFLLLFIPFLLFVGSLIHSNMKQKKRKHR